MEQITLKHRNPTTIVLTGGGSGGHLTPILAVAHELKQRQPDIRLVYIGERGGKFAHLTKDNPDFDRAYGVFSGKLRRYHGESWLKKLLDVKSNVLNFRDAFLVCIGIVQAWVLLRKLKPKVLFQKGGYVGMPVGLAAAAHKVPLVTHDSDVIPGLSNRVVSRWATYNATGMPVEYYKYPKERARYVGILLAKEYQPVTPVVQKQFKRELGLPETAQLLFITGGSNGAKSINDALVKVVPGLLERYPELYVVHQVGRGHAQAYGDYANNRLEVIEFVKGMYRYSGAADVIITRAGATNVAEFGVQGRACIVVPNPLLTEGHQLKNGEYLSQHNVAVVVEEKTIRQQPEQLAEEVEKLLTDPQARQEWGARLQKIIPTDGTQRVVDLILEAAD